MIQKLNIGSSLVAQKVKDPALLLLWHRLQLWYRFNPWPRNFQCHGCGHKKKKKKKKRERENLIHNLVVFHNWGEKNMIFKYIRCSEIMPLKYTLEKRMIKNSKMCYIRPKGETKLNVQIPENKDVRRPGCELQSQEIRRKI